MEQIEINIHVLLILATAVITVQADVSQDAEIYLDGRKAYRAIGPGGKSKYGSWPQMQHPSAGYLNNRMSGRPLLNGPLEGSRVKGGNQPGRYLLYKPQPLISTRASNPVAQGHFPSRYSNRVDGNREPEGGHTGFELPKLNRGIIESGPPPYDISIIGHPEVGHPHEMEFDSRSPLYDGSQVTHPVSNTIDTDYKWFGKKNKNKAHRGDFPHERTAIGAEVQRGELHYDKWIADPPSIDYSTGDYFEKGDRASVKAPEKDLNSPYASPPTELSSGDITNESRSQFAKVG